jgi:hypothetical protein
VNKKLKLTKLTVANLQRVKGGIDLCKCDINQGNGAWNRDHPTISVVVCVVPTEDC